jgi:uncharacterized protein (TIGR03067 family)
MLSVPASLVASTVQAAPAAAASLTAASGLISTNVAALTEGVLKAMLLTKLKALIPVVAAAALLVGGAGVLIIRTLADEPKASKDEAKKDKPKSDKEALQGTWITKSGEHNGEKFADNVLMNWEKLVFDDDSVTRKGGEEWVLTYTLFPDKKPKQIDMMQNGHTFEGVYELKGDSLKIAIRFNGSGRPSEISFAEGATLLVLEREKK